MRLARIFFLFVSLTLAACSAPDRFGTGTGPGPSGPATPGTGAGDPSDPTSVAYFQSSVGDRVFFAVDESTLDARARRVLEEQALWLVENPAYSITVEGHADEQGTREYNLALGARRASAVQQFLIAQGVPAGRLRTVTYGKERPVAICSEESCYAENRRAVTVLAAGAAGL